MISFSNDLLMKIPTHVYESDYLYGYMDTTFHYMREIGRKDQKVLIQLPRENN